MTGRDKEIMDAIGVLGDKATARNIGKMLSITSGYAEQLCNILVRKRHLAKVGYHFALAPQELPASHE